MEKTEKKTAEEILDKHIAIKLEAFPDIVPAMHEFAAQEVDAYKEMIGDILASYEQYGELPSVIIDRARKLIDKV